MIPFDLPASPIKKRLEKLCTSRRFSQSGIFYLLEDSVVLFGGIGAPAAILSMEQLIQTGVKEFVVLGFCGSLDPSFSIAETALIDRAFTEEGVSRHYLPSSREFHPSESLNRDIRKQLSANNLECRSSSIVSTDAPYRETKTWVNDQQNKGISLVDMETSAVFAVAEYHGLSSASLQIISDELSTGTWKTGFHRLELRAAVEKYFFTCIL